MNTIQYALRSRGGRLHGGAARWRRQPRHWGGIALVVAIICGGALGRPCPAVEAAGTRRTFYVDADRGHDEATGLAPVTAWRTLDQVNHAPLLPGDAVLFCRGQTWRGQLLPHSGNGSGVITYGAFGTGEKPCLLGSCAMDRPADWQAAGPGIWATIPAPPGPGDRLAVDVGNIIFDQGRSVGVKKWRVADLLHDNDFFYDPAARQVQLRAAANPAAAHHGIELALRRHVIDENGRSFVCYENLDLRYGAAHGIGGSSTHHITVRHCDISFIGGGQQGTGRDGRPVRYGNGIEFWSEAHDNLVEDCRLWEIYDAALTNQGDGTNRQEAITYRRNVIWNCEYSFELWNRGPASHTRQIVFTQNICVDAGYGWGHTQRPDPNGRHLMFYDNSSITEAVAIRHNIFCRATDSLLRLHGRDWTAALDLDGNCWYQPAGPLVLWGVEKISAEAFPAFGRAHGLAAHSLLADPQFQAPEQHDYRLAPNSPAHAIIGAD